ncbi:hypothetical protein BDF20DRAFT_940706 [Mycotypha africana]|uniref:uncharacterized protein n=1 Tax=Mycotypha africana TaxID=64632 RepID=UPI002300CE3F|nr:uncharacterized protein BDF20DRAFT_940706 [Mycotypha africana]KAI8979688.1 hypothetical protein BDF20DRAFT_940706 [Mycotypha africana]
MFKSIILDKKRQVFENRKADAFVDAICADCKKQGHFTKDYFKCDFYKASSADDVGSSRGKKRSQSFDVKKQKKRVRIEENLNEHQNHTVCSKSSSTARYLVFEARIFINYYVLESSAYVAPKCLSTQSFWYTVIKITNGQTVKNTSALPNGFIEAYNNFKTNYSSFTRSKTLVPGISQCIPEACMEIATSCLNNVIENFEQRLVYFLKFKLQMMFVVR